MTGIERAAMAIKNSGAYSPDWQGSDEDLFIMARAAIEAIREPSEAVVAIEDNFSWGPCGGATDPPDATAYAIWQAMIDALLNEKPE